MHTLRTIQQTGENKYYVRRLLINLLNLKFLHNYFKILRLCVLASIDSIFLSIDFPPHNR